MTTVINSRRIKLSRRSIIHISSESHENSNEDYGSAIIVANYASRVTFKPVECHNPVFPLHRIMWLVNATPLTIRSLCLSGLCSGSILALGVVALIVYHARLALTESHSYLVGVFVRRAIGTGRRTTLVKGTFKRISLFSSFLVDDWTGGYLNGTPDRFNECFRWCLGKLCSWLLKSNYAPRE